MASKKRKVDELTDAEVVEELVTDSGSDTSTEFPDEDRIRILKQIIQLTDENMELKIERATLEMEKLKLKQKFLVNAYEQRIRGLEARLNDLRSGYVGVNLDGEEYEIEDYWNGRHPFAEADNMGATKALIYLSRIMTVVNSEHDACRKHVSQLEDQYTTAKTAYANAHHDLINHRARLQQWEEWYPKLHNKLKETCERVD